MSNQLIFLFLAGGLGALLRDIVEDNKLKLPSIKDGELVLGFIGSTFIGAIAGLVVDGDPVTAGLAGYAGMSAIKAFINKNSITQATTKDKVEKKIREIAKEEIVDPDLAVRVAKCESNLNPLAVNINTDNSQDRGLFQINDKYHPEVSNIEAFDIEASTRFFCKAFKAGNIYWWKATEKCWTKYLDKVL
jgi:hypothetical protein